FHVHVLHRGQPDRLTLEWITTMNHDERGALISRITQDIFQVHDAALGQAEVVADADGRMDVNRKMQAAALGDQEAEKEVLKRAVVFGTGHPAGNIFLIYRFSLLAGRIAELRSAKIGNFEFQGNAALFLVVFKSAADEFQI